MKISPYSRRSISINLLAFLISFVLHAFVFAYALNLDIQTPKEPANSSLKLSLDKFRDPNSKKIDANIQISDQPKQIQKEPDQPKFITPKKQAIKKVKNAIKPTLNQEQNHTTTDAILSENTALQSSNAASQNTSKPINLKSDDELFIQIKDEIDKKVIYPRKAARLKQQDTVKLEFVLNENGLKSYALKTKSRFELLNEAALQALKKASPNFPKVSGEYRISLDIAFELR